MTKKDIAYLLSPSLFFIVVAITALFTSNMIRQYTRDDGSQQKFDAFVDNIQSGKWNFTTDRWLEAIRHEHMGVEAYRKASADTAKIFRDLIWASSAGILFQVTAVFLA